MGLNKICLHWTAGTNKPCNEDKKAYHFLVDGSGEVYSGLYAPEDNINCNDRKYAQHCGGGNTGCIGVSCCGMFYDKKKNKLYALTQIQVEAMCKKVAQLCKKYNIKVSPETVFTHYEFGLKHPKTSSAGKIDFTTISYLPHLPKERIGDYLRNKVSWYLLHI